MQLSRNEEKISNDVNQIILNFYNEVNKKCSMVERLVSDEIFQDRYMVEKKNFFAYSFPRDGEHWRNYYPTILIGVGPCFVSVLDLLPYEDASRFSMELNEFQINENLKLINLYFSI